MALTIRGVNVIDPFHYNGDPFWDGDQTLYELDVIDENERDSLLVVVQRGNAFIAPDAVGRYVEGLGLSLEELRSLAHRPGPGRRPQVSISIEPSDLTYQVEHAA